VVTIKAFIGIGHYNHYLLKPFVTDINSPNGRSTHGAAKGKTGEQCIMDKWQDNGASHAPNNRIKVNKTLTKNKKTYVINHLIVYIILCG
jgi:hypothetical protein